MTNSANDVRRKLRLLTLGLILVLAAYWAGSRWGPREPLFVEAVRDEQPDPRPQVLSGEEAENVRIYQQASQAVANIITRAVEYNFFFGAVPSEGAGSGFLIDTQGHVLTNFHVVQGAQQIEVILGDANKSRFAAKFVGGDVRNDVALIKIDARGRALKPLTLSNSSGLQVGQRVLAIGNPFGFQSTLTTGIISALGRTVQTGDNTLIDEAIQTDAAINRGNSGGPLLNSRGEVIGVNTAIYTPTGTTAGIGFAIPINTARRIAEDLIREGRVRRAVLGIEGAVALWSNLSDALDLPVSSGLLIQRVTPDGPADRVGMRGGNRRIVVGMQYMLIGGDVIVAFNGEKIASLFDLNVQLNRKKPGDTVTLTVYRGREKIEIKVTLGDG